MKAGDDSAFHQGVTLRFGDPQILSDFSNRHDILGGLMPITWIVGYSGVGLGGTGFRRQSVGGEADAQLTAATIVAKANAMRLISSASESGQFSKTRIVSPAALAPESTLCD